MKNRQSIMRTLAAAVIIFSLSACDKDEEIAPGSMPSEIQSFVSTHFPGNTIAQVVKDKDVFSRSYEVLLSGKVSLEFNRKKEIIEIESEEKLPNSVIPEKILQNVTTNYPNQFITDWKLDDRNQVVQLNNGLDLEFNKQGEFLRIDS